MILWLGLLLGQKVAGSQINYTIKYIDYAAKLFGAEYTIVLPSTSTNDQDKYAALSMQFQDKQTSVAKLWKPFSIFVSQDLWFDARLQKSLLTTNNGALQTLYRFIGTNPNIKSGMSAADLQKMLIPDKDTGFLIRLLPDMSSNQEKQIQAETVTVPTDLSAVGNAASGEFVNSAGLIDLSVAAPSTNYTIWIIVACAVGGFLLIVIVAVAYVRRSRPNTTGASGKEHAYRNNKGFTQGSRGENLRESMVTDMSTMERPNTQWSEYDEGIMSDTPTNSNTMYTDFTEKTGKSGKSGTVYTDFSSSNKRPTSNWSEIDAVRESQFASGELETMYTETTKYNNKNGKGTVYTDIETEYTENPMQTMYTEDASVNSKGKSLLSVPTDTTRTGMDTMFTDDDGYTVEASTMYTENVNTMYSDMSSLRESEYSKYATEFGTEYSDMRDSGLSEDYK